MADVWTLIWVVGGCWFFAAGSVGVLRFGDLRTRLHALTKADTLGLGCVVIGLLSQVGFWGGMKMVLVWVLALASAAVIAHLLARDADER